MPLFGKKEETKVDFSHLPRHVAIIMDGNGRWAKSRGLPRTAGHAAGAETFRTIATYCREIGISYLTVYAFSTENWKRPAEEVSAIMKLLK
ncbi:MAG: polyprenyl diphosphate synthase, partial [Lachnospirales bacterium]